MTNPMTHAERQTAEALVRTPAFRWTPGMVGIRHDGCTYRPSSTHVAYGRSPGRWWEGVPVLSDPATLDALEGLVADVWAPDPPPAYLALAARDRGEFCLAALEAFPNDRPHPYPEPEF